MLLKLWKFNHENHRLVVKPYTRLAVTQPLWDSALARRSGWLLYILSFVAGLRPNEILDIHVEDIVLERDTLNVFIQRKNSNFQGQLVKCTKHNLLAYFVDRRDLHFVEEGDFSRPGISLPSQSIPGLDGSSTNSQWFPFPTHSPWKPFNTPRKPTLGMFSSSSI